MPRLYLKRFVASSGRIFAYRTLVSVAHTPVFREASLRGVAFQSHLYTRVVAGGETDEFERWLDREIEAPTAEALEKAVAGSRLSRADWESLVRFVAAQDVRTPARLIEDMRRWQTDLPQLLDKTLRESAQKLEAAIEAGTELPRAETSDPETFPLHVTRTLKPGHEMGELRAEIVAGRGLWLWQIKHLLTKTAAVLLQHRWTVLIAPEGTPWFTSDDPVIKLNWYGHGSYDFRGGWGNPGSEILLPISPSHLLYTKVGDRPPPRGTVVDDVRARFTRRFIAEHAHRMIFAPSPDPDIPSLRPRTVSAELCTQEREEWRKWHEEQSAAERKLMGWDGD